MLRRLVTGCGVNAALRARIPVEAYPFVNRFSQDFDHGIFMRRLIWVGLGLFVIRDIRHQRLFVGGQAWISFSPGNFPGYAEDRGHAYPNTSHGFLVFPLHCCLQSIFELASDIDLPRSAVDGIAPYCAGL